MKSPEIFPKSSFKMKITFLEKIVEEEKESYRVVSSEWVKGNGKELRDSIYEDRKKGIHRTIEIVKEQPDKFKFNQIYMLPTRDKAWIYALKESEDNGLE